MKKLVLLFSFTALLGSQLHSNPIKEVFRGKPWEFLEYELIIKPKGNFGKWGAVIDKWFFTSMGSVAGLGVSSELLKNYDAPESFANKYLPYNSLVRSSVAAILAGTGAFVSGVATYNFMSKAIMRRVEFNALMRFVLDWPENKRFTPEDLHPMFEELYGGRIGGKDGLEARTEVIMNLIKQRIYLQFPDKYKDVQENIGASPVQVVIDVGRIVGVVAEIIAKYIWGVKQNERSHNER